jgi:hypothetical protein
MTLEHRQSYSYQTVNDFHQRKSGMSMFFSLSPGYQKRITEQMIGEQYVGLPRESLRQLVMKVLAGPKGHEMFDRIRVAYLSEVKQNDAHERT